MRISVKLCVGALATCCALALGGCDKAQDNTIPTSEVAITSGPPAEPASNEPANGEPVSAASR
jgi:hypothetical protein